MTVQEPAGIDEADEGESDLHQRRVAAYCKRGQRIWKTSPAIEQWTQGSFGFQIRQAFPFDDDRLAPLCG